MPARRHIRTPAASPGTGHGSSRSAARGKSLEPRVSSGISPICVRYIRTGSSDQFSTCSGSTSSPSEAASTSASASMSPSASTGVGLVDQQLGVGFLGVDDLLGQFLDLLGIGDDIVFEFIQQRVVQSDAPSKILRTDNPKKLKTGGANRGGRFMPSPTTRPRRRSANHSASRQCDSRGRQVQPHTGGPGGDGSEAGNRGA